MFILGIFDTDDVWLALATVVSIALIALVVGVYTWRLIETDVGERGAQAVRSALRAVRRCAGRRRRRARR